MAQINLYRRIPEDKYMRESITDTIEVVGYLSDLYWSDKEQMRLQKLDINAISIIFRSRSKYDRKSQANFEFKVEGREALEKNF